ncbi:hypothetical protein PR048_002008 [Dryococelus australis]|uniref:Uncharacterized protein n=1 Tax=Dryococelus australis TaxID=614101 RepID=A0ABQ9IKD0_9NEOP|nr:hypothetical protein PR048_002008 [Dryococelus australis]
MNRFLSILVSTLPRGGGGWDAVLGRYLLCSERWSPLLAWSRRRQRDVLAAYGYSLLHQEERRVSAGGGFVVVGCRGHRHNVKTAVELGKRHFLTLAAKMAVIGGMEIREILRGENEGKLRFCMRIRPFWTGKGEILAPRVHSPTPGSHGDVVDSAAHIITCGGFRSSSSNKWGLSLLHQDGAPAHYAIVSREYLNDVFRNIWIGRGSCQFIWNGHPEVRTCHNVMMLCGDTSNRRRLNTIDELKEAVRNPFASTTPAILRRILHLTWR